MSDTQAKLEARLRETPLAERLSESTSRIGKMCSEGRCPAMSIPVRETDDDFYISTTIRDAAAALAQSQARVAALEAALEALLDDGICDPNADEKSCAHCNAVGAARDALAGREGA